MKVKELIAIMKKTPPERDVIVSSDEEGNSFSPVVGVTEQVWDTQSGDLSAKYYRNKTTGEVTPIHPEWEKVCVVLWPE